VVNRRWRAAGVALAAAGGALLPATARACAVCYGRAEAPVLEGTRLSVVFLLVLTYLLLGGGVAGFLLRRRRAVERQNSIRTASTSEGLS
jgi:hypothetical protein